MSLARLVEVMSVGHNGTTFISDTAAHTGAWGLIIPIENTVFALLTDNGLDGNTIIGETIPANFPLYGKFTAITLTSGACVAYKLAG